MTSNRPRPSKRESGVSVLIVVVLLLLMAALVLNSLLQIAIGHLIQTPPNTAAIDTTVDGISVQSRSRDQGSAQAIVGETGSLSPPDGYELGAGYTSETFSLNITAESNAGSLVEVEGKMIRFSAVPDVY